MVILLLIPDLDLDPDLVMDMEGGAVVGVHMGVVCLLDLELHRARTILLVSGLPRTGLIPGLRLSWSQKDIPVRFRAIVGVRDGIMCCRARMCCLMGEFCLVSSDDGGSIIADRSLAKTG